MSSEHIVALGRLLDEALVLDPTDVDAWLMRLPPEQEGLRPQLREMLQEHRASTRERFLQDGPKIRHETRSRPGDLVGPYRLIREIGRGGMGAVWLAVRADGSLKRQIALKLPRLTWDTRLSERMARERDIAALLEHPNIARLYDAGVDAGGRPYLALEYIAGQHLNAWCRERALSLEDRLRLFLQVARAVAYAHGCLVVHRDLKPSNILVTPDGQAHLLDFGIAKLLDQGAAQHAQEHGRVLTPHYGAPEQVEGGPITVAADVYSLGVLLFELLTGRLPLASAHGDGAAWEAAVLVEEPPLASCCAADQATRRRLRGDLDAILAKALRRDPGRRYQSADAFARDVELHLAGEVVAARPASIGYRWAKFARRHRVGLASIASILVTILAGGTAAVVQSDRAARAAHRERVVREFVSEVFRADGQAQATRETSNRSPQWMIENSAQLIETRFAGEPELQAELYGVVGGVFYDMGDYQRAVQYGERQADGLARLNAGREERGRAALALAESLIGSELFDQAEARARDAMALLHDTPREDDAAVTLLRTEISSGEVARAQARLRELQSRPRLQDERPSRLRAWMLACQARLLDLQNRADEATPLFERAVAMALATEGELSLIAAELRLEMAGRLPVNQAVRAQQLFEQAESALRDRGGAYTIRVLMNAADKFGEDCGPGAVPDLAGIRRELQAQAFAFPAWFLSRIDSLMGICDVTNGDVTEGLRLIESSATAVREHLNNPMEQANYVSQIGSALMHAGRHEEADAAFRQGLELNRRILPESSPAMAYPYVYVAINLTMSGRLDEAETFLRAVPHFESWKGGVTESDPDITSLVAVWELGRLRLAQGRAKEALALYERSPPGPGAEERDVNRYRFHRGESLCEVGRPSEGLKWLEESLAGMLQVKAASPDAPWTARVQAAAGLCALAAGQAARARAHAAAARAAFAHQPGVSPYYKAPYFLLERKLGAATPASRPGHGGPWASADGDRSRPPPGVAGHAAGPSQ
jgi:tetratricopeptide (TPR) repeat protein